MASVDVLSGLANRRGLQSRLDFEWMKAEQTESELALLMIDVDHFKPFNDTYGHPEGDACMHPDRRDAGGNRQQGERLRRPLWRRGVLPAAAAHRRPAAPAQIGQIGARRGRRSADSAPDQRRFSASPSASASPARSRTKSDRPATCWKPPTPRSTPPSTAAATPWSSTASSAAPTTAAWRWRAEPAAGPARHKSRRPCPKPLTPHRLLWPSPAPHARIQARASTGLRPLSRALV